MFQLAHMVRQVSQLTLMKQMAPFLDPSPTPLPHVLITGATAALFSWLDFTAGLSSLLWCEKTNSLPKRDGEIPVSTIRKLA